MPLEELVGRFGYLAVFIGSLFEGDAVVLAAAFLAATGRLELPLVIAVAMAGTLIADNFFFHLGRRRGRQLIRRRPLWRLRARKVRSLMQRYQMLPVVGFRFLYGLRAVTPFVIGMSGFAPLRFFFFDLLGVTIWATTIAGLGFLFGGVVGRVIADVRDWEIVVVVSVLAAGLLVWLIVYLRGRRRAAEELAIEGLEPPRLLRRRRRRER